MKVSVIGLGKLGLPLAVVIAEGGNKVIGVDRNEDLIKRIGIETLQSVEPGLNEAVDRGIWNGRLQVTTDLDMAVHSSSVTVILVGTPSTLQGDFSLEYVLPAVDAVARSIAKKRSQHLVVISSTVNPGDCAGRIRSALGPKPLLAYVPEFVALGDVLNGFRYPAISVIGADSHVAHNQACNFVQSYASPDHPWHLMSLIEAELAKIGLNFAVSVKIATANWLAELCEQYPGTHVDVVTQAIAANERIGEKYFRGGPPFGGPCFPKDIKAACAYAIAYQGDSSLFTSFPRGVSLYNDHCYTRVLELLSLKEKDTLGIIGLAFKEGTDVTEGSLGMFLYKQPHRTKKVIFYDPLVDLAGDLPGKRRSVESVFLDADVVVLTQMQPILTGKFKPREGQTIIDCWRVLDGDYVRSTGATYIALGIGGESV